MQQKLQKKAPETLPSHMYQKELPVGEWSPIESSSLDSNNDKTETRPSLMNRNLNMTLLPTKRIIKLRRW